MYIVLTVHLSHGLYEVVWVLETDETIALCFLGPLVPDDLGLEERGVLGEGPRQEIIIDIVAKITNKYPKVIWREKSATVCERVIEFE